MKRPLAAAVGVSALLIVVFAAAVYFLGRGEGVSFLPAETPIFQGKVGLVEVYDAIVDPVPAMDALAGFRKRDDIKAIVLRVDSPGGGAGASQEIYREVVKTVEKKPVVASMGGVAASGGYYISAPATRIMANPSTITASIGVIITLPNLEGLFDKIGFKLQVVKAGEYKATGIGNRPLTEGEQKILQSLIDDTHRRFIEDVAKGRRLPVEQVAKIADGRIVTGQEAMKLGLVDQMGNLNDALDLAAKLGGISGEAEVVRPAREWPAMWRELFREEAGALLGRLVNQATAPRLEHRLTVSELER